MFLYKRELRGSALYPFAIQALFCGRENLEAFVKMKEVIEVFILFFLLTGYR
jgi:hypothetical protein